MSGRLVILTGGVGGAKLVEGAYHLHNRPELTAIVNTGDDFEHFGLCISPDIDSVVYALAGLSDPDRGWGRLGESWQFMRALTQLGGEDWFQLGDLDLATHVLRTHGLRTGQPLSAITAGHTAALGLDLHVLPMTDDSVATHVETDEGCLPFQRYFVERQCVPVLKCLSFAGASSAAPAPGVLAALEGASAIVLAPSNPFLSIDPILAVPGVRAAIQAAAAPVVAVSPLIGGISIKGPTSKIMAELGMSSSNDAIVGHYGDMLDGIVTHDGDPTPRELPSAQTNTLMRTIEDKRRVADCAIQLARQLRR